MNDIGSKIREIRKQNGMSLEEIARKCSMSYSFMSQVERNNANPSIGSLKKIADALGVSIVDFFESEEGDVKKNSVDVLRKNEHKTLYRPDTRIKYTLLSPNLQGNIEFLLIAGPSGSTSGATEFQHIGEEYGVIITGVMDIFVDGKKYTLREGDSLRFDSSRPHRWENPSDEEFIAVWAVYPPSF